MKLIIEFESEKERANFAKTNTARELAGADFSTLNPFYRRLLLMRVFTSPIGPVPFSLKIEGKVISADSSVTPENVATVITK